jgi:hypothetical protein
MPRWYCGMRTTAKIQLASVRPWTIASRPFLQLTPMIPILIPPVIPTQLLDLIVLAKVAIVAIFPDVTTARIEERVVPPTVRELEMVEDSSSHDGLGWKDGLQCDHRKKQRDEREDRLRVKVRAHVIRLQFRELFIRLQICDPSYTQLPQIDPFLSPHASQMVADVQALPPVVAIAVA